MIESKRPEAEIQFLQTLTQAASETSDLYSAFTVALRKICEFTNWEYGEVWITNQARNLLKLSPAWYINTHKGIASVEALEQFRLCSEAFVLAPGCGLPGRVWLSQQPEWISDISTQSETYFLRHYIAKAFGVKAGFGVPIVVNYQVLAVFAFFMLEPCAQNQQLVKLTVAAAAQLSEALGRR